MYTFEDWLNGNIKEKAPGGTNLVDDIDNGLTMLYGHYKLINKDEYYKILEAKKWAYDTALYFSLESTKKHKRALLENCEDKKMFINLELQEINKILEKNPRTFKNVIAGQKKFMLVSYSEYKEIQSEYDRYKKENRSSMRMLMKKTEDGKTPNLNYLVKLNYELKKWFESELKKLESEKSKQESQKTNMKTEHESKFFDLMENFCPVYTDEGKYDHLQVQTSFYNEAEAFKNEIIENCTLLDVERENKYLKRLKKRIQEVRKFKARDPEMGEFFNVGFRTHLQDKNLTLIVTPEEVNMYYNEVSRYKNELISFIDNLLNKPEKKEEELTEPQNQTKKIIEDNFNNMDEQGWEYAFRHKEDYKSFVDLLTKFFEQREYKLPDNIIKLKRDCKTKLAKTLRDIHRDLSEHKLRTDYNFFEIIRILNHFENLSNNELEKVLTR
jgi:hypothetical protein